MPGGWGTPSWMDPGPQIGEVFVQGKTKETAQGLLAAADATGTNRQEVRARAGGFIVPTAVYDYWEAQTNTEKF